MATPRQIAANRLNAKKSTGPRTIDGKAKVRLNAKRDGLTGQIITLSDEDRPVFEKLKAELVTDLAPKTVMELKLANSIAWDTWRLDHLRAVEMNMYAAGANDPDTEVECGNPELHTAMAGADTFNRESPRFALMSIYEHRINRSMHKNLETLRGLQAERRSKYEQDVRQEATIARANDINGLTYRAPARTSPNGFLFSTAEILSAANRETIVKTTRRDLAWSELKVQFEGAYDNFNPDRPNSGLTVIAAA